MAGSVARMRFYKESIGLPASVGQISLQNDYLADRVEALRWAVGTQAVSMRGEMNWLGVVASGVPCCCSGIEP
jgi:hypothetical protein